MLWLLACFVGVLLFVKSRFSREFKLLQKHYPGYHSLPVIGDVWKLAALHGPTDIYDFMMGMMSQFPNRCRINVGPFPYLFFYNADDIAAILSNNKEITKAKTYDLIRPWLGDGLLTSTGNKWRMHKKILVPSFNTKFLEKFLEIFNENNKIVCQMLKKHEDGEIFDIYPCMLAYSIDNICETALGVKINSLENEDSKFAKAVSMESYVITERALKPWYRSDLLFKLSGLGRQSRHALNIIHKQTDDIINERKTYYEDIKKNNKSEINWEEFNVREKVSFLDFALQASEKGSGFSHEDIRNEVDTIMLGGYDTTSTTLSFTLYELSQHPEIQTRVYQELCDLFGEDNREATMADLRDMKYLEQVIKETLRLYPPLLVTGRNYDEDMTLPGGQIIPKNTEIVILSTNLHRNPDLWENPNEFNPERFTPEASAKRHPYAYIPFSAGPRNCVGQKFAMLELKSLISHVLREFQLLPVTKPEDKLLPMVNIVLKSQTGAKLRIKRRQSQK